MFDVAVIIPVYNAEDFIFKAINSALLEEEIHEIIVVNDGSTDNTFTILKALSEQDQRIKIFNHAEGKNLGRSASRNLGIKKSTCNYIAFLDADDYFLPNRFKLEKEIFCKNKNVEGVYNAIGAHFYRKAVDNERRQLELTTVREHVSPEDLFYQISPMGKLGHFSGDGLTLKRSVFEKVGLFNEELEVAEDTHMWLKLALKCHLVGGELYKPVAMRGIHDKNIFNQTSKETYLLNYKAMWVDLLDWTIKNHYSKAKIYDIWKKTFESYNTLNPTKAYGTINWLKLVLKFPYLLKIKKIYKKLPVFEELIQTNDINLKINVLTRTSGRPKGFRACYESICEQRFENVRHIVSYDSKEDLKYLANCKIDLVQVSSKLNLTVSDTDYKPYNLYCNELLNEVEDGWILFLDDDNRLLNKESFNMLKKEINKADEDTILFFQTTYPNGSSIPEDSYFENKKIERYHIDTACFVFHSKYKEAAKWDEWRTADYRFIMELSKIIPKQRWVKKVLTYKYNFGDLGQRNDIE